ncbi:MAG: LptF/LptG family permease [Verrucomicrobiales bacterium]
MRILDRHIGRQVLTAAIIALFVLSVVMVVGHIFKRLLSLPTEVLREMPVVVLVKFVGYALIASLPFTVPWSLLTAALLVFGRMSADNEMLTLRMSGWSFARVSAPIIAIALVASILCFWINLQMAPIAESAIKRLPAIVATANPKAMLAADRIIDQIDDFIVYVGAKESEDELKDFQMIMLGEKRFPVGYISARRVSVSENKAEKGLDLMLYDSVAILRDSPTKGIQDSGPRNVQRIKPPIEAVVAPQSVRLSSLYEKLERITPRMLSMSQLKTRFREQLEMARSEPQSKKKKGAEVTAHQRACELRTEYHRRFSFSLACLVFTLVGMPLAVTAQRRETSIGFALSLVIGVVYLSFFILGDSIFKDDPSAYPHLLVWLPNVVFLALGGGMFWRLQRR